MLSVITQVITILEMKMASGRELILNIDYQNGDITIDNHLMLLNLISSKMTAKEYDEGMINLYFMSIKYGYDRYGLPRQKLMIMRLQRQNNGKMIYILYRRATTFHLLH